MDCNANSSPNPNSNSNIARAPFIKHTSPEVKDIVDFAERFRYVLELKLKNLEAIMQKSDNHYNADMAMVRIQALQWVQAITLKKALVESYAL
jgi:hypothetical protein